MNNLKARQAVWSAIREHGPFLRVSLSAYLSPSWTVSEINKAVAELVLLERVSVSKERQLSAV
jgi:hypothetical protein